MALDTQGDGLLSPEAGCKKLHPWRGSGGKLGCDQGTKLRYHKMGI